jgi:hypothetical protein
MAFSIMVEFCYAECHAECHGALMTVGFQTLLICKLGTNIGPKKLQDHKKSKTGWGNFIFGQILVVFLLIYKTVFYLHR